MQLNYTEALKRNNITEADMLSAAKKTHNDLLQMVEGLRKLQEIDLDELGEKERSKVESQIEKFEQAIEVLDANLVKKIDKHNYYGELGKKLKDGRNKNKSTPQQVEQTTQVVQQTQQVEEQKPSAEVINADQTTQVVQQTQQVEEQKPSAEVINADQTTTTVEITEENEKKKSSTGWGGIILGVTLLALTAGAVNYFRNKD